MMTVSVLGFGIVKDIFGGSLIRMETPDGSTVAQLKKLLEDRFPPLGQLSSYRIAINSAYADGNEFIQVNDEIALIPPVSGG